MRPHRRLRFLAVPVVLVATFSFLIRPQAAQAQPLADKVPADARIYFAWAGAEHLGPSYANSHLKAVLDNSNLPKLINETLPKLLQQIAERDPNAASPLQALSAIGPVMWRHPTAIYFGGADMGGGLIPVPKFAILVDAGQEADGLVNQVQALLANIPPQSPVQVQATNYNGLVCVSVGRTGDFDALLGGKAVVPAAPSLASRKEFKDEIGAMVKNPADTVTTLYVDVDGLVKLVDSIVGVIPNPDAMQKWGQARDLLGLGSIHRLVMTSGFDGQDWATAATLSTSNPRTGIAALIDGKPLTDDILKVIPQSATFAGAGRFSLSGLYKQLHELAGKLDPNAQANLDRALAQASQMLGLDIEHDLLEPIGDQWAVYSAPSVGGNGLLGLTLVNRLADPAKAQSSLNKLEATINEQITRNSPGQAKISIRQTSVGDLTIHYLPVPFVGPSWAVSDGNWYAALYPQVVASAAAQGKSGGKSILENEDFIALRKRLGGEKATGIEFYDLPKTAGDGYQLMLLLTQLAQGGAAMGGVEIPPILIPPLDKLLPHMTPAMSVTWSDEAGWHQKSVSPFPGATIVGSQQSALVGQSALLTSVLLPSLYRAKSTAMRVSSMSNLRQIGMACMLYANENNGKYPPDLGTMLTKEDLTLQVFMHPGGRMPVPANVLTGTPEAKAAWVNEHSDYAYVGAGKTTATSAADTVIAYEKNPEPGQPVSVLFGDGHVDAMPRASLQKFLGAQK